MPASVSAGRDYSFLEPINLVGTIGFEPIQQLQLFYRQPRLSNSGAHPNILVGTVCGVSAHLRSMPIVKNTWTTLRTSVILPKLFDVLYYLVFTTCVLSTGFSSPDTPSLLARCFSTVPGRVAFPFHTARNSPKLNTGNKKPPRFPWAASFYKLSGYFLVVSRLLIEGSHLNGILFIICTKPDPIRCAEALSG